MAIRPPRLETGDRVGVVSPASPPRDPAVFRASLARLRQWGFDPVLGAHAKRRAGFLAGSDAERAADLHHFFRDERVKAIVCLRGGYGSARLLPLVDFGLIRKHPKIFLGFSDITALQVAILKRTGLVTFHGPMLSSHLSKPDLDPLTREALARALMHPRPPGSIRQGAPDDRDVEVISPGRAEGVLVGGNLSVLTTLVGTPWWVSLKRKILILEEVDEAPYRIDRMLTFLLQTGKLEGVAGVAIGQCVRCEDRHDRFPRPQWREVFAERLRPLKVPVVAGLPFGHVPRNATLPLGVRAELDGRGADLIITQAAVQG